MARAHTWAGARRKQGFPPRWCKAGYIRRIVLAVRCVASPRVSSDPGRVSSTAEAGAEGTECAPNNEKIRTVLLIIQCYDYQLPIFHAIYFWKPPFMWFAPLEFPGKARRAAFWLLSHCSHAWSSQQANSARAGHVSPAWNDLHSEGSEQTQISTITHGWHCLSSMLSLFARACLEKPSRTNFPEALNHTPEQFQSFKHIGTFDHYDHPTPRVLFLLPFYRKGNSGSEKLENLPEITQQVSGLRQDSAELHLPK